MALAYFNPVGKGLSIFLEDWPDLVYYMQRSRCNLWFSVDYQKLGRHKRERDPSALALFCIPFV